ncbi:MAG: carbohydrate kinase family protein [Amnibacterium sp.]
MTTADGRPVMVSLGKPTQDLFVTCRAAFEPQLGPEGRVLTLPLGGKLDLDDVVMTTGGNAANAATTFARQGLPSIFLWAFGEDAGSAEMLASLAEDGIDLSHVVVEAGRVPSLSVILLSPSGERTILNHHGTRPSEGTKRLDLSPIADADWLYASSFAGDLGVLAEALTVARDAGTQVLLSPAGSELQQRPTLLALLARCDLLSMNASEARLLLGTHERDAAALAAAVAALGPGTLVTDAARGAAFCDRDGTVTVHRDGLVHDVVDTTGCGDAFASGVLARYALDVPVTECMAFAAANAENVLRFIGARPGILRAPLPVRALAGA